MMPGSTLAAIYTWYSIVPPALALALEALAIVGIVAVLFVTWRLTRSK